MRVQKTTSETSISKINKYTMISVKRIADTINS